MLSCGHVWVINLRFDAPNLHFADTKIVQHDDD